MPVSPEEEKEMVNEAGKEGGGAEAREGSLRRGGGKTGKGHVIVLAVDPDHCVETAARKEYERLVKAYLRGEGEEEETERKVELLREFLECADFGRLRRRCEEFFRRGEEKVKFFVSRGDGGLSCGILEEGREGGEG